MATDTLLKKVDSIEREILDIKAQLFARSTSPKITRGFRYAEPSILQALGKKRSAIWDKKYAKALTRLS